MPIEYREQGALPKDQVISLYQANGWSAADRPDELMKALHQSDHVISAWDAEHLVALGNAITDGALVVYYPHLLVRPEYHRKGIGGQIMERMIARYERMHQQILVAENPDAVAFYESIGMRPIPGASAMVVL